MKTRKGFILFKCMIVVTIIGLLVIVSLSRFIKALEERQKNACVENLRQIVAAKEKWTAAENKKQGDPVYEEELKKYIKGGRFPVCPGGGKYTIGAVGEMPTCSLEKKYAHKLLTYIYISYIRPAAKKKPEQIESKKEKPNISQPKETKKEK